MNLEEALEASVTEDVVTINDSTIVVNNDLRTMSIPEKVSILGVESDESVNRLKFRLPRYYCDLDLGEFNIYVNYLNGRTEDIYVVTDKKTTSEYVEFSWLVGRNASKNKGYTKFVLCLKKSGSDGTVIKEFNTTVHKLEVLEGLETEVDSSLITQNKDLNDLIDQIKIMIDLEGEKVISNLPKDYQKLTNEVKTLKDETSQLKEDLENQAVYSEGLKKSAVLNDVITETLYTGSAKNAPDTINKIYDSKNNHWQQFDSDYLGIVYEVKEGEQYVISGTSLNERFQLVNFFDTLETDRVLDFYPKVSDTYSGLKVVMELLRVPKNANYMLLNTRQDNTITVEKVTGYKDFKSETEKILADLEKTSIDVTEKTSELDQSCVKNEIMTDSVYNGRAGDNQNILNKMCALESDHWQTFDTDYCGVSYSVAEGEQYRITGTNINSSFSLINLFNSMEEVKGIQYYPSKDMVDADKKHYTGLKIQDYVVKIPPGCVRMVLNSHRSSTIKIEKITGYKDFKSETEKTLTDLNNSDDLKDFQIKNLQQRLFDTGKYNDFAFKEFDKTYFAFVIDDSNKTLYPIYKIFHDKGVKLSSATIPGNLNIAVDGIGTNKDVLDLIVADGGEVLVHYYGNLIDIGEQAPDTDRTYLNTVEDWDSRIVVTKKALEDMGYKIRGVIRADYTSSRTKTGEQYCREYYDYSDGLGTSPQYTLTRMFVHNFSTVEDFKKWIDKCCEKPGFYPICTHGSESVNDNMNEILDYILNKDNCECTTYKDVYDQFRSTVLENRIKALEEKVSG
jgi:hypothetical protein